MTREKVIYSIERCICHVPDVCRDCAYDAGHPFNECVEMLMKDVLELLKEQENQLTMKYEEGFHDGYKQAMRESVPCYECQEFSCDDCKFKDNRTVK